MPTHRSVLIVEDDPSIQTLLAAIVRRNWLEPSIVGDGRSAEAAIAAADYSAILLDLLVPIVNGFELLRHMKCTRPDLLRRVIVLTAAHEHTTRDCEELRYVHAFLRKPFEVDVLESELMACLRFSSEANRIGA